jgi:hypothetical protein
VRVRAQSSHAPVCPPHSGKPDAAGTGSFAQGGSGTVPMGEDVRDRTWGGMDMNARMSRPVFGLVLLTFLMPFVSASCEGFTFVTLSGSDLVLGKDMSMFDGAGPSSGSVDREPWAVAAAVVASLGVLAGIGGVGALLGLAGVGSLLALRWTMLEKSAENAALGISLDFEWGYWLAIVGFGLAAVASLGSGETSTPAPTTASGSSSPRKKNGLRACPFCFEEVPSDSAFCQRCGTDISAIPPRVWE